MTFSDGRARAATAIDRDAAGAMEHDAAGPADDMEDTDPGLARERTGMAWTRTAISFAALGGAVLKTTAPAGALVLAMSAVVWGLGRMSRHPQGRENPRWNRHLLITLTVTLVSLVALAVVLLAGNSPPRIRI